MKTYEIKMSRSRWMSLLIAILLVVVLVNLCAPYFTYGVDSSKLLPPDDGQASRLVGTWYLDGSDASQDNYREIEILDGVKAMKVRTTNIIRKNQLTADEALATAVKNYEAIAKALTEAETYREQAKVYYDVTKTAYDALVAEKAKADEALKAESAIDEANAWYQQALYTQEIEKLNAELKAAEEKLANTKAAYEAANKNLTDVEAALKGDDTAKIAELKALLDSSTAELATADAEYKALTTKLTDVTNQIAVVTAANDEFKKNAYDESVAQYASLSQLDMTVIDRNLSNMKKQYDTASDKYAELEAGLKTAEAAVLNAIEAVKQAYSADATYAIVEEDAAAFTAERDAAINEKIISKLPSLKDAEDAKAAADAAKKDADAVAKTSKSAMDAAKKAMDEAEKYLKALSEPVAVLPAAIADAAPARAAGAAAAANALFPNGAETEKEKEIEKLAADQKVIADAQIAEKANIDSAKALLTRLTDAYAQVEAAMAIKAAQEDPANKTKAEEALEAAKKDYEAKKAVYDVDKAAQDAAKKDADDKKAALENLTKEHEEAIAAVSEVDKDNYVLEKLNADKEKAAAAAATANQIIKDAAKLAEMYEKSNGALQSAKKAYDSAVKEYDKFFKNLDGMVDARLLVIPEIKVVSKEEADATDATALEAALTVGYTKYVEDFYADEYAKVVEKAKKVAFKAYFDKNAGETIPAYADFEAKYAETLTAAFDAEYAKYAESAEAAVTKEEFAKDFANLVVDAEVAEIKAEELTVIMPELFDKETLKPLTEEEYKAAYADSLVKTIVLTPVTMIEIEEIERPAEQVATSEIIETEGKVKYSFKKGVGALELTFANGKKVNTDFMSSFSYDGIKKISIMSYIGFPYDATQFADEMATKIPNFYINDVVLVPIIIGILALIGLVMCFLKRDKMSSAYVPAALGIVGIIGYLTSDFLKLGDKYLIHIIVYAAITVVSALQIYLHAKNKKSA